MFTCTRTTMGFVSLWLLLVVCASVCNAAMQIVGREGTIVTSGAISDYLRKKQIDADARIQTVGIVDCTGRSDCSTINSVVAAYFSPEEVGVQMDVTANVAVLYSSYDSIYSTGFGGSKAIDYHCALHASPAHTTLCLAMRADDLDLSMKTFDQIFRRLSKYMSERYQAKGSDGARKQPLQLVVLMDESEIDNSEESTVADYEGRVQAYLAKIWEETDDKTPLDAAVQLKLVLVRADDPVLLQQARDSWRSLASRSSDTVAASLPADGAEADADAGGGSSAAEGNAGGGMTPAELDTVLTRTWLRIPTDPVPILGKEERDALYAVETTYTSCLDQAEVAIRQWQTRAAKGRTVAKFASRVNDLRASVGRDFERGVSRCAPSVLLRERAQRQRMLSEHIVTSAGRLYQQQLAIIEFNTLNNFRRELAKIVAADGLTEEAQKEQQQLQLRKALFAYRAQAADLEDADLGFALSEARVAELTTTLETVLSEFPESALAKLEEVRKVERQAKAGKTSGPAAGGRGRKRKGLAKALGVSLSVVGMLRPPGYGNLQGFIGYATSLLGLPLDLLLGVQNDGDSPEIMGEDREYPILRLQPKVKFDIDLQ